MTSAGINGLIHNAWLRLIAEQARNWFTIFVQHRNSPRGTRVSSNIVNGGSDDAKARDNIGLMLQQQRLVYVARALFMLCMSPSFYRAHRRSDREGPVCRVGTLTPGPVAQRIEQQPSKLKVAGSIPAGVAMISIA
jgi:hypothetical protein